MSHITCAVSGLQFKTDHIPSLYIPHTAGYFHPVFACDHKQLHQLYSAHTAGKLTPTDSYLLFLGILHSTGQIEWRHPATLDPTSSSTRVLIENNIHQLLSVIAKTDAILHPSFQQPSFVVSHHNSDLEQVHSYIAAWEDNVDNFYFRKAEQKDRNDLNKVENYLSTLILSGEDTSKHAHIVADWADIAAEFPSSDRELWKRTIRTCFNVTKMFNTPLSLLKEIKDYCECNIEAGSIHFHTLSKVLKSGIRCHIDYLGGSTLARGYELLPELADSDTLASLVQNEKAVSTVVATVSHLTCAPVAADYATSMSFLKARLAYRVKKGQDDRNKEVLDKL